MNEGESLWTDSRTEQLKVLWKLGDKSAAEIAQMLGGGLSRNAVLGKIHRLQRHAGSTLPAHRPRAPRERVFVAGGGRGNPGQPKAIAIIKRAEQRDAVPPDFKLLRSDFWTPLPGRVPVPLVELGRGDCKWPLGDPLQPGFGFCGCKVAAEGRPYCEVHTAISTGRAVVAEAERMTA